MSITITKKHVVSFAYTLITMTGITYCLSILKNINWEEGSILPYITVFMLPILVTIWTHNCRLCNWVIFQTHKNALQTTCYYVIFIALMFCVIGSYIVVQLSAEVIFTINTGLSQMFNYLASNVQYVGVVMTLVSYINAILLIAAMVIISLKDEVFLGISLSYICVSVLSFDMSIVSMFHSISSENEVIPFLLSSAFLFGFGISLSIIFLILTKFRFHKKL